MITYEQIKQIAALFCSHTSHGYSEQGYANKFDEWASGPGKELMEKLNSTPNTDKLDEIRKQVEAAELLREGQTQAIKNSTAICAYGNIVKIVTGVNPLVSQPSNSAPVSPDKDKRLCLMCEKWIDVGTKCHNCGEGLIPPDYPTAEQILQNGILPYPTEQEQHPYEPNVQRIAEEMAHKAYLEQDAFGCSETDFWEDDKEHWIKMFDSIARIAVKQMDKAFKAGFFFCKQYYQLEENHSDSFVVEEEQIKMGFVPPKGGENE